MRIYAKIRQVFDRLCERKEASADWMHQERAHLSEQANEAYERERLLAVQRDSQLLGLHTPNL